MITMKRLILFLSAMLSLLSTDATAKTLVVYYSYTDNSQEIVNTQTSQIEADVTPTFAEENTTMDKMYITIGGQTQLVTLVDNDATRELVAALQSAPITVTLNDNNFEIWGSLGRSLTTKNEQMTAQPGDVVLYSGQYICIFYDTNSWSYTRLGKIDGLSGSQLRTFLKAGQNNISVTLSLTSGTTAIKSVNGNRMEDGAYYSLNGVKVKNPSKGIYIKNGKKVIL